MPKNITDLTKLKEILENQAERGIESGEWDRLDSTATTDQGFNVCIDSIRMGFRFSDRGRLIAMWTISEAAKRRTDG